jgi:hypothetical protein
MSKHPTQKRAGGVAQAVECLLCKHEALSSKEKERSLVCKSENVIPVKALSRSGCMPRKSQFSMNLVSILPNKGLKLNFLSVSADLRQYRRVFKRFSSVTS